jgi:hypothetical protein
VSALSRVLACILNLLQNFLNCDFLSLLQLAYFSHHIFEHIADQKLSVFVALHALVNFNSNHFANLVSYLYLLTPKAINLVAYTVPDFSKF